MKLQARTSQVAIVIRRQPSHA